MNTPSGFDVSFNRHGGNPESNRAFQRSRPFHQSVKEKIYALICAADHRGINSHEIEVILGKPKNDFSGRLTQLVAEGRIKKCGERLGAALYVPVEKQRSLGI